MEKKQFIFFLIIIILLLSVILFAIFRNGVDGNSEMSQEPINNIPSNAYYAENFYFEDGFMQYRQADYLKGIDVSVHQGLIDWQRVADSGVDYAIIRAGYRGSTVGDLYEDEQFAYNLTQAREAGLLVGVYFFSQALNEQEAAEEARYVCSLLDGAKLDLPVYFDWEYIGGRISQISDVDLTQCAKAFCEEVERQGYKAGVYFNQEFGYYYLDLFALQEYHLWLAEYNETPTFRYHFDCLQFTDSGRVDGIETTVDLNILFLSE